ncbi:hypothetical protein JHK82_052286 [Glycine max]|nr:hypothetical protein JHK86_052118 [Glycine max]KAG5082126.1 hypothetical protein JHK84_052164 [Glycine max]KAG5084889.1 hypothetical protein JHK82_052286 [Glycine max]
MFIQESLRLYGPGVTTAREVLAEMKLGEHVLPKGIKMWLYLPAILQRDTDNWGPDAREFKLERLAGEMKEALCLLLSNFSFAVSPNYRHCPVYRMLLTPKYGETQMSQSSPQSSSSNPSPSRPPPVGLGWAHLRVWASLDGSRPAMTKKVKLLGLKNLRASLRTCLPVKLEAPRITTSIIV